MPDLALQRVVVEGKKWEVLESATLHNSQWHFCSSLQLLSRCAAAFSIHTGHISVNTIEEHRTRLPMDTVLELRF